MQDLDEEELEGVDFDNDDPDAWRESLDSYKEEPAPNKSE
jgi:hypothetical protein